MHLPKYDVRFGENSLVYYFESVGDKGVTEKMIQFTPLSNGLAYNLSFGDLDVTRQRLNDRVVSNNGDKEMVLATVISAVYCFTNENTNVWIYIKGSTKSRTRLYRMIINLYSGILLEDFVVIGEIHGKWEKFEGTKNYSSFVFKKRIN